MRTQEEIEYAIEKATEAWSELPAKDFYGNDNAGALEAILYALRHKVTDETDIVDRYPDDFVHNEGAQAVQWLNEEIELDDWIE